MNTKEFVTKVKEVVARGWCQGTLYLDAKGEATMDEKCAARCCLLGAMFKVSEDEALINEVEARIISQVKRSIVSWNDEPGRTQEQVVSILEKVEASL